MDDPEATEQLIVADVLGLPPFLDTDWELLTPRAELSRPVRWVHTIGVPKPAPLLQGGEFVLSTLPRFTEDREDLVDALRTYLDDLDSVSASALAVEIFEDRPRLLEALRRLVAERETERQTSAPQAETLPIILFTAEVRFVEITEDFHRSLVTRQLAHEMTPESHDPLFDASTQLIGDVLGGRIDAAEAADRRAQALGMAGAAHYRSLMLRFRTPSQLSAAERAHAQELIAQTVRAVASRAQTRVLVGETPSKDVGMLLALPRRQEQTSESAFCLAVRSATEQVRAPEVVPAFVIAAGEPSSTVLEAVHQLGSAQQVLTSLETLLPRAERFPGFGAAAVERGYWKAADLGVLGLLARVEDPEVISWFTSAQLGRLRGPNAGELRALIRALAAATGTKAELAAQLGISRPTLYARMHKLERTIGQPLDGDALMTLHIGLLMEDLHG